MFADNTYKANIEHFKTELPYKNAPYNKKTWGHKWHSISSYQGKMKPAIAYWLVKLFTKQGDSVLDPLGGSGTIPFEACLQGRKGITNDLSPFAITVGAAKMKIVNKVQVEIELKSMKAFVEQKKLSQEELGAANFGLNSSVKDYFHPDTLQEILKLRIYFQENLKWNVAQNFIRANLLHILHGNRPYALSRNSHSLTPYKPSGEFIYKNVFDKLEERFDKLYKEEFPKEFIEGEYYIGNFNKLDSEIKKVDSIITSPPFVGMRFDRQNWMRMWFMGWEEEDFLNPDSEFLERIQHKNWDIYNEFFEMCNSVLKANGNLILHLGGSIKYDMVTEIKSRATKYFELIDTVNEEVGESEKHGIKDKGTTNQHIYLFFKRK